MVGILLKPHFIIMSIFVFLSVEPLLCATDAVIIKETMLDKKCLNCKFEKTCDIKATMQKKYAVIRSGEFNCSLWEAEQDKLEKQNKNALEVLKRANFVEGCESYRCKQREDAIRDAVEIMTGAWK
jgi:hypothetical protein